MRGSCILVLVLAAGIAVPAGGAALPGRESARPVVRVADWSPLKVRGVSFKRSERVRLTVRVDGRRLVRRVRATRAGAFTAVFAGATVVDRCGFSVVAVGSGGSRASFKLPLTACPPPLSP